MIDINNIKNDFPILKKQVNNDNWETIPWESLYKDYDDDWRIFARSASDAKGPINSFLIALDIIEEKKIKPDYNIKVIMDMEEEMGSPNLPPAVKKFRKKLKLFEKYGVSAIRVEEDRLLPAINKAVFGKSKRIYVGPINTGNGFAVIEIIKRFPKGTYRNLDDVYDNIYLMIKKRKAAIKSVAIIDSLKQEYLFELNFGGL